MRRSVYLLALIGLITKTSFAIGPDDHRPSSEPALKGKSDMSAAIEENDRKQIIEHIHGLFKAYIRKDRDAIRRGHAEDWRGFQVRSDHIVRGIDEYMSVADKILSTMNGRRYKLVETDVHLYGDMAVVYYRANYWLLDGEGREVLMPLRSVDIYRRDKTGWNQCGSNICLMPPKDEPAPGSTGDVAVAHPLSESDHRQLLADREAVWRACFANDQPSLKRLLPIDTVAVNAGEEEWKVGRRAVLEGIEQFGAGGNKLVSLEFPRTEIQSIGDIVILYTTYMFVTEKDGQRQTHSGRGTEIFMRRDGKWINPGWHLDSGR